MNSEEAKRILLAWRPDSMDERDPEVAQALAHAEKDPTLREWLEKHRAFQQATRRAFREAPVPAGLARKILAARLKQVAAPWWRRPAALAAAATIAFLVGLASFWMRPMPEDSFATFRSRMVGNVLRQYTMDIVTNDMATIDRHLAIAHAPSNFSLPPALARLPASGAGVMSWQDRKASMLCLDSTNSRTLFLFVVDRSSVARPPQRQPTFAQVSQLMTASWTEGGWAYVAAMSGREEDLRNYFTK